MKLRVEEVNLKKYSTVRKKKERNSSFGTCAKAKIREVGCNRIYAHPQITFVFPPTKGVIGSSSAISISRDKLLTGSSNHRTRNRSPNRIFRSNNFQVPIKA